MKGTTIFIGGRKHIEVSDIICLKSDINYTTVYFKKGSFVVVATPLKTIQQRLEQHSNFYRVTKSLIINVDCIKLEKDKSVYLKSGEKVIPSRRRAKAFYELFAAKTQYKYH